MSRVFAENQNNDIYLGSDNKLVVNEGLEAALQACKASVEIQLGEAIYSQENGMPNKTVIWSGTPNIPQFEFYARKQIMGVSGVVEIESFTAQQIDDVIAYQATIKTIYGTGVINV